MNADRLVAAYDDLLAAAALLDLADLTPPQRDEAEWLIAHLILSDPILIAAADHLLAGADTVTVTVTVDNRHAMDPDPSRRCSPPSPTKSASKPSATTPTSSSTGTAGSPRPPAPPPCSSSSTTDTASSPTKAPPPGPSSSRQEQTITSPATPHTLRRTADLRP